MNYCCFELLLLLTLHKQFFLKSTWGVTYITGVIIADTTATSTVEGTLVPSDLGWGLVVYLEVLFARSVVMCMLFPILRRCGYGLTRAEAAVCVWGGLRGSVGLALALVRGGGKRWEMGRVRGCFVGLGIIRGFDFFFFLHVMTYKPNNQSDTTNTNNPPPPLTTLVARA